MNRGPIRRVAVIGLGLIGGSLARALNSSYDVVGADSDPATRELARAAGLTVAEDLPTALAGADLVVVATSLANAAATVHSVTGSAATVHSVTGSAATVTDVASVKSPILAAAHDAGLAGRFVGGHPMAGTEQAGFAAGEPGLLAGAAWVLCVEPDTDLDRWLGVAALATGLGARVVPATAAEHDEAVARISHLPHLLAAAMATVAAAAGPLALQLAAGSFRDATRVAAADPSLATAMCALNADAIDTAVQALGQQLTKPDRAALIDAGHRIRVGWPPAPPPPVRWPLHADLRDRLLALGRRGGWVEAVLPDRLAVRDPG